jgi:hypothetical protein
MREKQSERGSAPKRWKGIAPEKIADTRTRDPSGKATDAMTAPEVVHESNPEIAHASNIETAHASDIDHAPETEPPPEISLGAGQIAIVTAAVEEANESEKAEESVVAHEKRLQATLHHTLRTPHPHPDEDLEPTITTARDNDQAPSSPPSSSPRLTRS